MLTNLANSPICWLAPTSAMSSPGPRRPTRACDRDTHLIKPKPFENPGAEFGEETAHPRSRSVSYAFPEAGGRKMGGQGHSGRPGLLSTEHLPTCWRVSWARAGSTDHQKAIEGPSRPGSDPTPTPRNLSITSVSPSLYLVIPSLPPRVSTEEVGTLGSCWSEIHQR